MLKIFWAPLRGAFPVFIFGVDDAALALGIGALASGGAATAVGAIQGGDLNRENRDFAEMMNQRSFDQARQVNSAQMAFQEHMFERNLAVSNSAYQRATADMEKAGINPALAFMKGGADTPGGAASGGGASGTAGSPSTTPLRYDNPFPAAMSSALEFNRMQRENFESVAQVNKVNADAAESSSAAELNKKLADKAVAETSRIDRDYKSGSYFSKFGNVGAKVSEGISSSADKIMGIWNQYQKKNLDNQMNRKPQSYPTLGVEGL